jgi:hypothetical protein
MNNDFCSLIGAELKCEEFALAYSQAGCGRDADEEAFKRLRRPTMPLAAGPARTQ